MSHFFPTTLHIPGVFQWTLSFCKWKTYFKGPQEKNKTKLRWFRSSNLPPKQFQKKTHQFLRTCSLPSIFSQMTRGNQKKKLPQKNKWPQVTDKIQESSHKTHKVCIHPSPQHGHKVFPHKRRSFFVSMKSWGRAPLNGAENKWVTARVISPLYVEL